MKFKTKYKIKFNINKLFMVLLFICIFSCKTPIAVSPQATYFGDREIVDNLGKSEATISVSSYFGYTIGEIDLQKAAKIAVDKKKGDALINVSITQVEYQFILFGYTDFIIAGDVIKLKGKK